jgi:hypothetical protein
MRLTVRLGLGPAGVWPPPKKRGGVRYVALHQKSATLAIISQYPKLNKTAAQYKSQRFFRYEV